MKTLNKTATKVFESLIAGLAVGQARKFDNAPGAFMAVSVDRLSENLYAVAHRKEVNGDLVSDPDVEFYVAGGMVAPTAIDQSFGYRREVIFGEGGKITGYRPRGQADLTSFCNLWMRNIKAQQRDLTVKEAA